ncbi:MAG: IS982 family transposase [Pseudomonadota bacterium]
MSDGLPLPTCHPKRVRKNNPLKADGAFGYCAAKDEYYFGFKGHLLTNDDGLILNFAIAPANVDERDILPEIVDGISGLVIADKGLISPSLKDDLAKYGIDLQTPLRKNMTDKRPKWLINWAMNTRRIIETVNGQLAGRFNIQSIRAKDLWHFSSKVLRKILAHSFAFMIAGSLKFDEILNG